MNLDGGRRWCLSGHLGTLLVCGPSFAQGRCERTDRRASHYTGGSESPPRAHSKWRRQRIDNCELTTVPAHKLVAVHRDMVPDFTQNANCLLQVIVSDEHMVGVVRRDREYADAGRRERCRQPGQYTDHLQVQGAANRQHRPRPIGHDARRNNTRVAHDGQFRRRTRDREERSLRDPGWEPIIGRQATERVRARD